MIFGDLGAQEDYFGGPGVHLEDRLDCCDFGSVPATKGYLRVEPEMRPLTLFLECCVFDVVLSAHFFLIFWQNQ